MVISGDSILLPSSGNDWLKYIPGISSFKVLEEDYYYDNFKIDSVSQDRLVLECNCSGRWVHFPYIRPKPHTENPELTISSYFEREEQMQTIEISPDGSFKIAHEISDAQNNYYSGTLDPIQTKKLFNRINYLRYEKKKELYDYKISSGVSLGGTTVFFDGTNYYEPLPSASEDIDEAILSLIASSVNDVGKDKYSLSSGHPFFQHGKITSASSFYQHLKYLQQEAPIRFAIPRETESGLEIGPYLDMDGYYNYGRYLGVTGEVYIGADGKNGLIRYRTEDASFVDWKGLSEKLDKSKGYTPAIIDGKKVSVWVPVYQKGTLMYNYYGW